MKVLLVEDDEMIADGIIQGIKKASMQIEHANTIATARKAIKGEGLGLLILDLGLPDGDGLTLLKELRNQKIQLPILILTARDEPRDRVLGLDTGADDYLIKPFDINELVARVRALIRRSMGRTAPTIIYGELTFNPEEMEITYQKEITTIPLRQLRLLQYLLECQGRVKTKQQIIDALYRWDHDIEENTIEVYISQLRKKLWPTLIKTMRGIGYLIPKLESHH